MEKCYEYFQCHYKYHCPAYSTKTDNNCWEIEGTLLNHKALDVIAKYNNNKCDFCQYFICKDKENRMK